MDERTASISNSVEDMLNATLASLIDTKSTIGNTYARMTGPKPSSPEATAKEAGPLGVRDLLVRVRTMAEQVNKSAVELNNSFN